jgi:hypothetical protein
LEKEKNNLEVPILIIGYNRPDLLVERLREIESLGTNKLYISLDGFKSENANAETKEILLRRRAAIKKIVGKSHITIWESEFNQGLAVNVSSSISKVLKLEQHVLIIEEDISISKAAYDAMVVQIQKQTQDPNRVICLFSPYTMPTGLSSRLMPTNRWRKSPYFSPWGWYVSRRSWSSYSLKLPHNFLEILEGSHTWRKLSVISQSIWTNRFQKVYNNPNFTWDYQFQYLMFINNYYARAPIYRLVENEGFQDTRSTNTKLKKPRWIFGDFNQRNTVFHGAVDNRFVERILRIADENTWVGTGSLFHLIKLLKARFQF